MPFKGEDASATTNCDKELFNGLQIRTKLLWDTIAIVKKERRKPATDKCGLQSPGRLLVGRGRGEVIYLIDVQQNTFAIQMISPLFRQVKWCWRQWCHLSCLSNLLAPSLSDASTLFLAKNSDERRNNNAARCSRRTRVSVAHRSLIRHTDLYL